MLAEFLQLPVHRVSPQGIRRDFIRRLKPISEAEREAAFARTFGCLSPEEADEMERVIEEGCEQVNEHGW